MADTERDRNEGLRETKRMLRQAAMENKCPFLDDGYLDQAQDTLKIVFQNVQNFRKNRDQLATDYGYMNADIMLLVECHNTSAQRTSAEHCLLTSKGYEMVHFTYGTSMGSSNGQICYVRSSLRNRLRLVAHTANAQNGYFGDGQCKVTEMTLFEYTNETNERVHILSLYRHNGRSVRDFFNDLGRFIFDHAPRENLHLLVLGDFNIDFNKDADSLSYMRTKFNLRPLFEQEISFRNVSHIDWAFVGSRFSHTVRSQVYNTWFSDHAALWTEVEFT
jgi:endonuclease/exonuclease/phosphatase family metal-dependent hydrolase